MEWMFDPASLMTLGVLTLLEIVLGIDNIIFLAILVNKLPAHQQKSARIIGLLLAMLTRILFLLSLTWIMRLSEPLFHIFTIGISGRDLVLILGGGFLAIKGTQEIAQMFKPVAKSHDPKGRQAGGHYVLVLIQIAIMDIVFSIDSVVTAVGLSNQIEIMILAIMISIGVMLVFAAAISRFIDSNPSIKMLALSFLVLIGIVLVAYGINMPISKGYLYFAMGFSLMVELLNIHLRNQH